MNVILYIYIYICFGSRMSCLPLRSDPLSRLAAVFLLSTNNNSYHCICVFVSCTHKR